MPNLSFVAVTFAIHLALALWIGGTIFLGALAAPSVFRAAPSRTSAGAIVGQMVNGFARMKALCMIVLVAAAWVRFRRWEIWNDWIAVRAAFILAACVFESIATWGIGPRIRAARAAVEEAGLDFDPQGPRPEIPRPETRRNAAVDSKNAAVDSKNARADSGNDTDHPLRKRFRKLHGWVMGLQSLAALAAAGALFTFF